MTFTAPPIVTCKSKIQVSQLELMLNQLKKNILIFGGVTHFSKLRQKKHADSSGLKAEPTQ
jgi:hypothetical protein